MADYLYLITTKSGYYVGKQSESKQEYGYLTEHHGLHALERVGGEKKNEKKFEASLENQGAEAIKVDGMQASLKNFILSARRSNLDTIYQYFYSSVNNALDKVKQHKSLTLGEGLSNSFGAKDLELTEALAILVLPKSVAAQPSKIVHNLKVDFFSPGPKNGVTQEWVQQTVLGQTADTPSSTWGPAAVKREIFVNLTAWTQFVDKSAHGLNKQVKANLSEILNDKKFSSILGKVIAQTIDINNETIQGNSKAALWIKAHAAEITKSIKERKNANLLLDDSSTYQQAFIAGYKNYSTNILDFWTNQMPNEIEQDYVQNYYKKAIAKQFQAYCPESFETSQYDSLSKTIRKKFENGKYITGHGAQFYAEQMSIYYGELFGPLAPINETPTALGEYEFGREKLKRGQRIRVLFTSKSPTIKDDVHKPEFMTIY